MNSPSPRTVRKACWAIVTAFFLVSFALSVLTVDNYQDIARARALTLFSTETTTLFSYDGNGTLESLDLRVDMTVHNPSGKELRLWLVGYKAWLRDWPMEDGTDTSRRTIDGDLVVDNTTRWYYPVFSASFAFGTEEVLIPAHTDHVVGRTLRVDDTVEAAIMKDVRAILEHANATGRGAEWFDYSSVRIFIQAIHGAVEDQGEDFLILRVVGKDLTPGSAGVGG